MYLKSKRKEIDRIDSELLNLLAERKETVREIFSHKRKNKIPLYDPERELEIINRVREAAEKRGLDSRYVEEIFRKILQESKTLQKKELK